MGFPAANFISGEDSMKLTSKTISRFSPPAGKLDHIEFDDDLPGFGLRIRNGKASFVYQYAFGTAPNRVNRRIMLGSFPGLPAEKARNLAQDLSAKVRLGGDPALDKKTARAESRNTFGAVVDKFLEMRKATHRPSTHCEATRYLRDFAKPLHNLPVKSIARHNIAELLDSVSARGTVTCNRMRSALSACFSWAITRGYADINPVIGTEKLTEKSRDRVLSDSELAIIWKSVPDDDFGAIVKLLILSGQRRDEISALRWDEIDLDNSLISLPAERTKNKKPHEVPLSAPMKAILSSRKRIEGRDLVFGKRVEAIAGWGWRKERLDAAIGDKIKMPWTLHDIRRSCASRMADIGILPHVIEAALNHQSGTKRGVAGVYNRSTYAPEKKRALNKWADRVLAIINEAPSNVTPLHGRA
jgi:integrase